MAIAAGPACAPRPHRPPPEPSVTDPQLLNRLRTTTAVLLALDLSLLLLMAWQGDRLGSWLAPARYFSAAVSALLAAGVWVLLRRLDASQQQVERDRRLLNDAFDAVPAAVALFDADDRLLLCNADFRRVYAPMADLFTPGSAFEPLLRAAIGRGLVPEARGREDDWVASRVAAHRQPAGLMVQQQALEGARRAAELAAARLHDAIEALPAGFELYDADDRLVMTNRVVRGMYPLIADLAERGDPRPTFEDVVRTHHARGGLPHLPDEAALQAWLARRQAERRGPAGVPPVSHLVQQADGRWIRSHERRTQEGGVVGVRLDVTDIETQRADTEAARRAAEQAGQRLSDAIEALPDAFVLYDDDDRILAFNSRYPELYASSQAAIRTGASFEQVLRHGLAQGQYPQAAGREAAWLDERLAQRRQPCGPQIQELPGNRWVRIDERRTRDGGIAGVRTEITELVQREQELSQLNARLAALNSQLSALSDTDALTGLANRRHFDRRLADELARAARHGVPLALVLFDVDHFKAYNDRQGHLAGDACLLEVAAVLRRSAQHPTDLVARWGGEEFAMLLPHASADDAGTRAQRCIDALDAQALPHGASPLAGHVTLSAGLAIFDAPHATSADALLQAADAALYRAKQADRHRIAT